MKKNELLALPVPRLPQARGDAVYRLDTVQYILRSILSKDKRMLIIAFFDREAAANGSSNPSGVLYLGRDQYLTHCWKDGREYWKESRLPRVMDRIRSQKSICLTKQDENRILSFLKKWDPDAGNYLQNYLWDITFKIEEYQTHILERRLLATKERRAQQIDRRMEEVPLIPSAFENWLKEGPLLHSRYALYLRTNRNMAHCFCTHCQSQFWTVRDSEGLFPAHNKEGICPVCHSKIIYKHRRKISGLRDSANAALFQKTQKGELLLRYFTADWEYISFERRGEIRLFERARLFFNTSGEITGQYKYGYSAKTGRHGWYDTKDRLTGPLEHLSYEVRLGMYQTQVNVWFQQYHLYPYNLHAMLRYANLSYDLKRYLREPVDVTGYLLNGLQYPYAPSLYRIGLERVTKDILEEYAVPISPDVPGPLHKKFGVPKEMMSWVKKYQWGMKEINLLVAIGCKITEEELGWILNNDISAQHISYLRQFMSIHKLIRYLDRQVRERKSTPQWYTGSLAKTYAGDWKDYLQMCENLGYDIRQDRVLFPKNLRDEHDKMVQLTRMHFDVEMDQKIQKLYPALDRDYSYAAGGYLIRPPKDFQEFIDEGANLLHCVCTNRYYVSHVNGRNLIFFVRKENEPEQPFYTMEYNAAEGEVLQLRGFRNQDPPAEVESFVDGWVTLHQRTSQRAA